MINRLLHALSNRSVFSTPAFIPDPAFIPAQFNADTLALRQALLLDVDTTDYYLQVYLGLLEAYPDLKNLFQDFQTSYRLPEFLPRGVQIDGADLLSTPAIGGRFTDPPNERLPLALTWRLDCQDHNTCQISAVETSQVWLTDYQLVNMPSGQLLQLNWPAGVPFAGVLRLNQPWVLGSRIQILVSPSQFPYAVLVQRVRQVPSLSALLSRFNLTSAFAGSFEATEQLALILTALGLDNPAINLPGA